MAAVLQSPVSIHDAASKADMSHLSGATMADLVMEPTFHLVTASPSKGSSIQMKSNRSSMVSTSTTKSTLRHSNQLLIEMLQNIQTELSAHRSIMLDIQHRVSHLEHESVASANGDAPQLAALQALEGHGSKRNSRLVPPEGQTWWQACQNFARNSDPPMSAAEFLRTPKRFSGIDWQYGPPSAKPQTPPMTPPDVEELPPLTPTSEDEDSEHSDIDTPRAKHDVEINADEVIASTPKEAEVEIQDDIKESFVDVDKKKMPSAPILHPPPGGKPISVNSEEVITAVPTAPVASIDNPHRYYKGKRSLATYQAVLKHKKTDKEQIVLIHFHNRSALKDLEE